jgi:hypothetical protein
MPVFPSQNLNTQKICESYPRLLQIYSGSLVLDGTGSLKQFLNVTSSYSLTSSYATNFGNSITQSFSASNIWTFNHNLGDKYVLIQTVDTNDNQLIPEVINLFDDNTAIIGFSVPTAGTAIATRGGIRKLIISSSYGYYNLNTGSTYPITSSWALYAVSASYVPCNCSLLQTGSTYPITSSWSINALTASYALNSSGTNLQTGSTYPITSSWSINAVSASYAPCNCSLLQTGSYYPITASWAINTQTSSYIQVTGVSYPVRRVYNNYTIVRTTDYTILCDATSGSFNVKLPNPVGNTNIYNIKKIDTSGHRINVTVTNASYIDYDFTQSISHKGTNMVVQSDGSNQYWIL